MKKKVFISLIIFSFLIFPLIGLAEALPGGGSGPYYLNTNPNSNSNSNNSGYNPANGSGSSGVNNPIGMEPLGWNSTSFLKILDDIFNALFYILLIAAAIGIVVAGIYFVTASGDTSKTKTARDFVVYSLVGVLVGFLAKAMIAFVNSIVK